MQSKSSIAVLASIFQKVALGFLYFFQAIAIAVEKIDKLQATIAYPFQKTYSFFLGLYSFGSNLFVPVYSLIVLPFQAFSVLCNHLTVITRGIGSKLNDLLSASGKFFCYVAEIIVTLLMLGKRAEDVRSDNRLLVENKDTVAVKSNKVVKRSL